MSAYDLASLTVATPVVHRLNSTGHEDDHAPRSRPSVARRGLMRRFSAICSTEDHFRANEGDEGFFGAYGHVRKKLDETYHAHYVKERQWLHDSIIEDFLVNRDYSDACHPGDPWLVFTVGAQGAGKRHTIDTLVQDGRLQLLSFIFVDADEIRRMLPEYTSYVENSPALVNALTQKECGYIAETLALAALQAGRNVIFDGTLHEASWYVRYVRGLRETFSHLKVGMIHVTASEETILRRAREHAEVTGRTLNDREIVVALQHIPASIKLMEASVDYFYEIQNENTKELVGGDWDTFSSTFIQTCSMKSKRRLSQLEQKDASLAALRRTGQHRRFSIFRSSEENHMLDELAFHGKYAHIRETLDYSYHSNYKFERQIFQDAIIEDFLNSAVLQDKNGEVCTTPTEPWMVFTAGAMGAGKGYTKKKLVEMGRFPLMAFVNVDPDAIRHRLPEYYLYVNESPELAGELTRKEAGFIAEILALAGLQVGKNVLMDGSLRDSEWYKVYFKRLREEFPPLRLAIIHVTAPRDAVFQRAADRAISTGRIVPRELLILAMKQVPMSVKILAPLVDYHVELSNAPNAPLELVTPGETWESFASQWVQACAWVPRSNVARVLKEKLSSSDSSPSLRGSDTQENGGT